MYLRSFNTHPFQSDHASRGIALVGSATPPGWIDPGTKHRGVQPETPVHTPHEINLDDGIADQYRPGGAEGAE